MRRYPQEGYYDVHAYFNKDAEGYAVANARTLTVLMRTRRKG